MEKTISITDLKIDQKIIQVPFALNQFEQKVSRVGKPYYNIQLTDKTGDIRGKIWTESMSKVDGGLQAGDIVLVTGQIQEYAGKPQLVATELRLAKDMAPEEFLPITSRDRSEMIAKLDQEIANTSNPFLKQLLELFWNNENYKDRYINHPAGMYVHHGYVGGLLEHVFEMNELSKPYLDLYPEVDRDLLFVGIFFHDVGKLDEVEIIGATITIGTEGTLVGHIGLGLLLINKLIDQVEDFPKDLRDKVYHLILSHQSEPALGSPVKAQMLESIVLSKVDDDGAYMNQIMGMIKNSTQTAEDFTEYNRRIDRSIYKKGFGDLEPVK